MVRAEDNTELVPIKESPVLQRLGLTSEAIYDSDGKPVKAGEWVKQRIIKNLGTTSTEQGDNNESGVEIIKGVRTQYYN